MNKIDNDIINNFNKDYNQLLGYGPKRQAINLLSRDKWEKFVQKYNLNPKSEGVFIPRISTSFINKESSIYPINLFHEYYGHGLFFEYTKEGKFIESMEKRLVNDEKRYFRDKKISIKSLENYRESNPHFKMLNNFRGNSIKYELFAIWTEYFLSKKFCLESLFEQRYGGFNDFVKDSLNEIINFQDNYGTLGTFYTFGFPKYPNKNRIENILSSIYGQEKLKSLDLVLLYGSKKPYSDIDLYILSEDNDIGDVESTWIDIKVEKKKIFEDRLRNFDVYISSFLLNSDFILGEKSYYHQMKEQLVSLPITESMIKYNLLNSKIQRDYAYKNPKNSGERIRGLSYASTYLKNALALKQGIKKFSKDSLIHWNNHCLHSRKNILMKGGMLK